MSRAEEFSPKLEVFIDGKLKTHGAFQEILKKYIGFQGLPNKAQALEIRQAFVYIAETMVGIREEPKNSNTGRMVSLIQDSSGSETDTFAWCMRFVQAVIGYWELKTGMTVPVHRSGSCWSVWAKTSKKQRVKNIPSIGAIIIWQDGDGVKQGSGGHTGLVTSYDADSKSFVAIEGNTSAGTLPDGSPISEGGGVYRTVRKDIRHDGKKTKTKKIVGFLKPFP